MTSHSLVLVHAPSVYDFRTRPTLWGPISDLVPSTPIFEMYPIGFTTIAEYLQRRGMRVRIANLAVRMLLDDGFDAESFLASLDATAFGVDLHWLPHAHGAVEIARLIKKHHPATPVIVGGLSASYFHEELASYPQVDYVLRGDSTEEPLYRLMELLESGGADRARLEKIPNLTWKDRTGTVHVNPLSHAPLHLDDLLIDYSAVVRAVARDRNLKDYLPFLKWKRYPIMAALSCRGCTQNCTICGGSRSAYAEKFGRRSVGFRSPESLARDIRRITGYSRGPVFVLGDIRQAGLDHARAFLRAIQGIDSQVIFEFFWGVERPFMEEIAGAVRHFVVQFSPESHDPRVLRLAGKSFTPETIRSSIDGILAAGAERVDVFFMTGLPGQTSASVMESIEYCRRLLLTFSDPRLRFFVSPLAPFLDPGSPAYEHPERYGYVRKYHTLREHREALLAPSWKYVLGYETKWMNRSRIVDSTYQAALRLNRIKSDFGQIPEENALIMEDRITRAVRLMKRIDDLLLYGDGAHGEEDLQRLKEEIDEVNSSTVCEKEELDLPVRGKRPVKIINAAGMIIGDTFKRNRRRTQGFAGSR